MNNPMSFAEYLRLLEREASLDPHDLDEAAKEKLEFTKLNLHRTRRIGRSYKISPHLEELLASISCSLTWMVLTETWCGDSAQCLPQIAAMADCNEKIELVLLRRDENPVVMDAYLTDGKRSIPVLVARDGKGEEIFRWGPRPTQAQSVFDAAKAEGLEKPTILERLHLFYGRNRGRALEAEFIALLEAVAD